MSHGPQMHGPVVGLVAVAIAVFLLYRRLFLVRPRTRTRRAGVGHSDPCDEAVDGTATPAPVRVDGPGARQDERHTIAAPVRPVVSVSDSPKSTAASSPWIG